jgi:hypothetical protein
MSNRLFRIALACALTLAMPAAAAHTEQRYYSILVDGKEAGQAKLTITEQEDGVCYVAASASVKLGGLFSYSFQIDAQEWWKNGKLVGMKSLCNDNGRKCDLLASHDGAALRLRVNGMDRAVNAEPWTSSFWKLADAKYHNKQVPILAADTGEERLAQLQYVGSERLTVANVPTACYRFRVTGTANPIDLWFDQHHRLVRQEFTESGHKTIIQLISRR